VPRATAPIFSSGPWRGEEGSGSPQHPLRIGEVEVIEQLRTRRDEPGALVALADGRYAYTGPVTAVGSPGQLQDAARRRLRQARTDGERAWWREVIGALAAG
jgi:cell volume regulation protein A